MSQKTKKLILFGSVLVVWLGLDLWTKDWADTNLANHLHPLPARVTAEDAGKTLGELMQARFGWTAEEAAQRVPVDVERLTPAPGYAATDRPFATDGPTAMARGFWVFWRDSLEDAPRRFEKNEPTYVAQWLRLAFPGADSQKVQAAVHGMVGGLTFAAWLPDRFAHLDAEDVAALAPERIHPIMPAEAYLAAGVGVKEGEVYLLTNERVDVMGDWFKLVYAENPGAAFGFLKTASAGTRNLLFGLLTIVAFLVVFFIVWRLPPGGSLVYIAFAGILAGAMGNFIDRLRYSYVIDFIDMDLGFMHWPTYNVADIAISLGVVALILDITFNKNSPLVAQKKAKKEAADGAAPAPRADAAA